MIKRLSAIGFIFVCTSIAWSMLAGVTERRTHSADESLRRQVERVWGEPQTQLPPAGAWNEQVKRSLDTWASGRKKVEWYEERVTQPATLDASNINVALGLEHRQKGLLWYAIYGVDFAATYTLVNEANASRELEIALPFPSKDALFDGLRFEIEGRAWLAAPEPVDGRIVGRITAAPGERLLLHVGYRSQGLNRWTYSFGTGIAQVRNFRLNVRTNFAAIDFPDGSISPARKERAGEGWVLGWEFRRLVSGVNIAIVMPEKLQPGPLASQIAGFAPVSLTGLAVTIGAIVTLFVLMQTTAKIQWNEVFAGRAARVSA